ncbi:MAG: RsmB/NOP family class I SAM-dependent RNA methyltransferase [Rhodocyclaceae bacterium]|nr:RsmB/NOP family class I SAM-dependent RNA methyltransferase [Rhodocyclaceae bacterium]MBX3668310.1 RsmB/NOP family class I SAM-dependent RNA methyltransferase [Rhodocyclaceae bacterium]
MHLYPALLAAASEALAQVLELKFPADSVLSRFFRENPALGQRDRAFVAETVYAVLRRRRYLERTTGVRSTPRRLILAACLLLQGMNRRQLADVLKASDEAWLTALYAPPEPPLTLAEQADLPDWLADRLGAKMDAAALLTLAAALNQPAPLDLRVNPLKMTREDVLARLAADGIEARPGQYSPLAVRLAGKPALAQHPLFLEGAVEVQDEGSQLLAFLTAPRRGEMVADFCAGAGGKTLALGALMRNTGRLYAFDVSDKRLIKLRPRLARSGLSNVHPVRIAHENDSHVKRLAGKLDRVLVDAPCSGLGTLRRNPDLKWRQSAAGVAELAAKQRAILAGAARLVKPGGRLVYATCSLLEEENSAVVADFLAAHGEFQVQDAATSFGDVNIALTGGPYLELAPHTHGTDGFFAAVMERNKA